MNAARFSREQHPRSDRAAQPERQQRRGGTTNERELTVLVETGDNYSELRGVMIKGEARLVDDPAYVLSIYGALAAKYPMINDTPVVLEGEAMLMIPGREAA